MAVARVWILSKLFARIQVPMKVIVEGLNHPKCHQTLVGILHKGVNLEYDHMLLHTVAAKSMPHVYTCLGLKLQVVSSTTSSTRILWAPPSITRTCPRNTRLVLADWFTCAIQRMPGQETGRAGCCGSREVLATFL